MGFLRCFYSAGALLTLHYSENIQHSTYSMENTAWNMGAMEKVSGSYEGTPLQMKTNRWREAFVEVGLGW